MDNATKRGLARAASLTAERRSEIAKKAADKRWGKQTFLLVNEVQNVIAGSPDKLLKIGGAEMEAYVLENGMRVLSGRGMQRALGFLQDSGNRLKLFLEKSNIKPHVDEEIYLEINNPIKFNRPISGDKKRTTIANAFDANILKRICDVVLKSRRENPDDFTENDLLVAKQAEILLSGFAEIGITALVDEVTGYKKQKDEYQKILEAYIEKELRPWLMTFDDNYYKQIYRLLGWSWDAFRGSGKNHPSYIGKLTNRIVYEKLPPGVLEALDKINPKNDHGNRLARHHQHLTDNIGYRHLIKHISAVTTIMEMYPEGAWDEALHRIDTRFPTLRLPQQLALAI